MCETKCTKGRVLNSRFKDIQPACPQNGRQNCGGDYKLGGNLHIEKDLSDIATPKVKSWKNLCSAQCLIT